MRKLLIILFVIICNIGYSQFSCVKTIVKDDCRISLLNVNGIKVGDLDLSQTSWYFQSATNIKVSDNVNVFNLLNTCITSPSWASLPDSLTSWQTQCVGTAGSVSVTFPSNLDTTQVDTSLVNYSAKFDTTINRLDSILANLKTQTSKDTTHTAILQFIQDSLNSKLSILDKSDIDTSLAQVIQLNQIIDSLSVLINKSSTDTTHTQILSEIKELLIVINSRVDTSSIDTSLVPQIDYTQLIYALINKGFDTTQQDTALDKHVYLDSTLVRIINDTLVVKFIDSTYYTQLDSIKYYLSHNDSIEICFDTITFNTNVVNLPIVDCNGDSAVRVQICNIDTSLNIKIDTTNAILYRIESKPSSNNLDTTHNAVLREISDTLTHLSEIVNELKSDCIGSNETYYIDGTNSVTINASEICSYTITVIGGDVDFSENGVSSPFSLPNGYTGSNSFKNGTKFLINQITFTGTAGSSKAIIKIIK